MKTIRNILFIAIMAFILSTTVNAKETELKVASSHENIEETTLSLENWMLEESYWLASNSENLNLEVEDTLELEAWMLDESNWEVNKETFEQEDESKLVLESWMDNANFWEQ